MKKINLSLLAVTFFGNSYSASQRPSSIFLKNTCPEDIIIEFNRSGGSKSLTIKSNQTEEIYAPLFYVIIHYPGASKNFIIPKIDSDYCFFITQGVFRGTTCHLPRN